MNDNNNDHTKTATSRSISNDTTTIVTLAIDNDDCNINGNVDHTSSSSSSSTKTRLRIDIRSSCCCTSTTTIITRTIMKVFLVLVGAVVVLYYDDILIISKYSGINLDTKQSKTKFLTTTSKARRKSCPQDNTISIINSSTDITTTTTNDARDIVHIPMYEWETYSMIERVCMPEPYNIPTYCCIGSMSAGGGIDFAPANCNKGIMTYNRTEQLAMIELQKYPIIIPSESVSQQQSTTPTTTNEHCSTTTTSSSSSSNNHRYIKCDICRIIDILIERNWSMAFQGDSITRQTFIGLECEIHRRSSYTITNTSGSSSLYSIQRHDVFEAKDKPHWRIGLDNIIELHISYNNNNNNKKDGDTTNATQQQDNNNNKKAIIRLYAMYRPNIENVTEIQQIVQNNDIIIFDHGLHYGVASDPCFEDHMAPLLQTYIDTEKELSNQQQHNSKIQLLIWRETAAQHFKNSKDGSFIPGIAETECAPIIDDNNDATTTTSNNRLMDMMQNVLQTNPEFATRLKIIPFREYTKQLYDLHVTKDCSHFCSSPALWLPLWRHIRNAMEEIV